MSVIMMNQSKLSSLIEVAFNIAIGFTINFIANMWILPAYGFETLTWQVNLQLGVVYTVISVIRSYVVRRWFNAMLHKAALKLAGMDS